MSARAYQLSVGGHAARLLNSETCRGPPVPTNNGNGSFQSGQIRCDSAP